MKQEEKTGLTKQRIMAAAMNEFGAKGYYGASLNNICAAGIPKGLLYHNFKNKDALYLACVERCFTRLANALKSAGAGADIRRYMAARMQFFKENEPEARLFFEAVLEPPQRLQEAVAEAKKEFDSLNRSLYQGILSAFTLRDGVSEQDAMEYFAMIQNTFHLYFKKYNALPMPERAAAHETMLSKLLDMMLYGIAKGGEGK